MDRIRQIGQWLDRLLDHYVVLCLFAALFILSFTGAGNIVVTGLLGLLLCAAGLMQGSVKVDLWILLPLLIYNLFGFASSCAAHGNTVAGYAAIQLIFPVLYLLAACLQKEELQWLRRMCAGWAAAVAFAGIVWFAYRAVWQGTAGRLGGILGNANALGIFLVLGWFMWKECEAEKEEREGAWQCLEPLILAGLALTLSMGSFLSMAAGIAVLLWEKGRHASLRETFFHAVCMLARVGLGVALGIFLYLAAARTDFPQSCLLVFLYILLAALCWPGLGRLLEQCEGLAVGISGMGMLLALVVIAIRPSAAATFSERLEMIQNGLKYITVNPFLGVGPYRWRILNLYDSDKYFNTYHIHNVFVHVAVELGFFAMGMLLIITLRCFLKKKHPAQYACAAAFLFHSMMDTGFFYPAIVALAMLAAGEAGERGSAVRAAVTRLIFGVSGVMFAWNLWCYSRLG